MCPIYIGQCVQYILDKVFILLVKDLNVQFVRLSQDFLTLAIICPIISSSKSHFVQPNVVCPAHAVPTFCTPDSHPLRLVKSYLVILSGFSNLGLLEPPTFYLDTHLGKLEILI